MSAGSLFYLAGGTAKLLKLFTENRHKRVEGRQTFCYTGNDRIFGQCSRNRAAGAGTARRRNEKCPLPTHTAALAQMCWTICPRRCGKSWRRTGSCTISACTGRMCCSITMRKSPPRSPRWATPCTTSRAERSLTGHGGWCTRKPTARLRWPTRWALCAILRWTAPATPLWNSLPERAV